MRRASVAPLLLVMVLAAACGGTSPSSGVATTPPSASTSSPLGSTAPSSAPSGTAAGPSASGAPSASVPAPSASSSDAAPSDSGQAAVSPTPSGPPLACNPEGSSPTFWPQAAKSVAWGVYCAVLPKGWVVSSGKFRLASGGWLKISYNGPGGATLSLSEGVFCTDSSGCVPSGTDTGAASFGDLSGTLVTTDAGGYAIVVARAQNPSWLLVTTGLDQATTVALSAALSHVSP